MLGVRLRAKYFPVIVGLILVISSSVIVTSSSRSTQSISVVSTQSIGFSTMVGTASSQSASISLSINSVSQTSSGLASGEFASSSQPYYATSSLPPVSTTVPSLWLNFSRRKKRRARSEIYIDILELVKDRGPMTPFEIALYARLNLKRAKDCITFLSLCNYLQQTREMDCRTSYVLTKEGLKFLERAEAFFNDHR